MKNLALLLGTVERRPVREESVARRTFPWGGIISAIPLVVVLGALPFMLRALWDAWQTGDWLWFWAWMGGDFQALIPVSQITAQGWQLADARRKRDDVQALRRRVAAGDVEAAPPAPTQLPPLESFELPVGPTSFGPLKSAPSGRGTGRMAAGVVLLVLAVSAAVVAIVFATAPLKGSQDKLPFATVLAATAVAGALGLPGVWLLIAGIRRGRAPVEITADGWGVRWRSANGRERTIAWHEARAFYMLSDTTGLAAHLRTIYVLDALDRALLWQLEPQASAERREVSERLVRLIATRTGLPLRDVTGEMEAIDGASNPTVVPTQVQRVHIALGALSSTAAPTLPTPSALPALSGSPASQSKGRRRSGSLAGCLVFLVALLLLGLVAGAGALLQREQQDYLAGLPARVHAERPLFQDSLTQDDNLWPLQDPTKDAPSSYGYAGGGYQLTGAGESYSMFAWTVPVFQNYAIEVTARQTGTGDNDGVGLLLSKDGRTDSQLAFVVSPTAGTWWLGRYNVVTDSWETLWPDSFSDAIRTGDNVSNRLLVIMHGGTYICYANDRLLGTVNDPAYTPPVSAYVGVYLNNGALAGIFNDFAVYPAQPAASFFYV